MDFSFKDEQRVSILLAALQERYESIRTIRGRIDSICIWALGLLLAASGWLIQSDVVLTSQDKIVFGIGAVAAFVALRFLYLKDLQNGFKSQQRTTVRLEKALGLFSAGVFDDQSKSIYPKEWETAGTLKGKGNFFDSNYVLLYIGVIFLLLAIVYHH